MKILKYLLGLIAVVLLIVVVRGLLTPDISYDSEITVDKSIKEAWAVMNDESKIDQWLQGITDIEFVSGKKGEVGAVTKYTFNQDGTESEVIETIKSVSANESIAMDFEMKDVMNMAYQVAFAEKDGKTHIKSSTTTTASGFMMKCLMPFLKGSMQAQEDENMGKLKKLINENKTDYFPIIEKLDEVMQ